MRPFQKFATLPGFMGSLELGVSLDRSLHVGLDNSQNVERGITIQYGLAEDEYNLRQRADLEGSGSDGEGNPEQEEEELHKKFSTLSMLPY
ncbi:hypothetical protein P691DRAFT_806931, partial [Macrolepiota fuliginosa MF-IS2]